MRRDEVDHEEPAKEPGAITGKPERLVSKIAVCGEEGLFPCRTIRIVQAEAETGQGITGQPQLDEVPGLALEGKPDTAPGSAGQAIPPRADYGDRDEEQQEQPCPNLKSGIDHYAALDERPRVRQSIIRKAEQECRFQGAVHEFSRIAMIREPVAGEFRLAEQILSHLDLRLIIVQTECDDGQEGIDEMDAEERASRPMKDRRMGVRVIAVGLDCRLRPCEVKRLILANRSVQVCIGRSVELQRGIARTKKGASHLVHEALMPGVNARISRTL